MKTERKLKVALLILIIILISLVSFGGILVKKTKFVDNILPEYLLGMDLTGSRALKFIVSKDTKDIIYDKDGNVVDEAGEGTTTKKEPINPEETLTKENYASSKQTFIDRLNKMSVSDYTVRLNESTGDIFVQLPENSNTDTITQYLTSRGYFSIQDEDGNELLSGEHLKNAQVASSSGTSGVYIYLIIEFDEEGTQILKNITNTYVETEDEEGNDTTKSVDLKIDDTTLISTHFDEEISNGTIQLTVGQATTSATTLNSYIREASNMAILLNTKTLPVTYEIEENRYIKSDLVLESFYIPMIVLAVIALIALVYLIIRYKKNGLLSAIAFIGYVAVLLLVVRFCNVVLTVEGITGLIIAIILNYIFTIYLMNLIKNRDEKTIEATSNCFKEALLKAIFILIPVLITSVILCFVSWLPIYSFGMAMFWGILIIVLYNLIFTRTLIVLCTKNK